MSSRALSLGLIIGGIFGFVAALMAYLIVCDEYTHHYPDKKKPRKIAFEMAIITFIFFFSSALAACYLIMKYL